MSNRIPRITAAILACIVLAACQGTGPKQQLGSLIGAVAGGVAGSQFGKGDGRLAAVGIGTLVGAAIGGEVGSSLDKADRLHAARAEQHALEHAPSGTPIAWSNPDTGHGGTVTAAPAVQRGNTVCREYTHTIVIGAEQHRAVGRACRQPDGTWRIQPG